MALVFDRDKPLIAPLSNLHVFLPQWDFRGDLIRVVISQKLSAGVYQYYLVSEYTKDKIVRSFSFNGKDKIKLADFLNSPSGKNSGVILENFKEEYEHNLGYVPLMIISNKPYVPTLISYNYLDHYWSTLALTYNGSYLREGIENTWIQLGNEIRRGRTMIIASIEGQDTQIENEALAQRLWEFDQGDAVNYVEGQDIQYQGGQFVGLPNLINAFNEQLKHYLEKVFYCA